MVNVFVAMPQLIDYFIQLFSKTVQLLLGVATRSKEQQQFGAGAAVGFLLWTGPNCDNSIISSASDIIFQYFQIIIDQNQIQIRIRIIVRVRVIVIIES